MTKEIKPNQLQVILDEQHIEKTEAQALVEAFGGPFNEVGEILADYETIKVTDVDDVEGMRAARTKRLALKKARTTVENKRKELKEGIVKQGRAIDSIARFVKETIAPAEAYLQLQEDYRKLEVERQAEAKRLARREELVKRGAAPELYAYETMPDAAFEQLLSDLDYKAKQDAEAAAAAEAERKAAAEREAAEQAKRDRENARLRQVAALGMRLDDGTLYYGDHDLANFTEMLELDDKAFDAKVNDLLAAMKALEADARAAREAEQAKQQLVAKRKEWLSSLGAVFNGEDYRLAAKTPGMDGIIVSLQEIENDSDEAFAKALQLVENVSKANAKYDEQRDAELKAEREKAAALEQQERDRADRDAKAKAAAEEAERLALLAPDKTKLQTFADALEMIRTTKLPAVKTKQAQDIVNDIDAELQRLKATITAKANRLK